MVDITLVNLCVTRSKTMHLTLSCEVHHFRIIPFGQPENGGCCVHIWFLARVPSIRDFDSVTHCPSSHQYQACDWRIAGLCC
jgi:hypothetical protein